MRPRGVAHVDGARAGEVLPRRRDEVVDEEVRREPDEVARRETERERGRGAVDVCWVDCGVGSSGCVCGARLAGSGGGRTGRDVDVRVRRGPVPDGALAQRLGGAVCFNGVCVGVDLLFLDGVPICRMNGSVSDTQRVDRCPGHSRCVLNDTPSTVGSPLMAAVELVTTNLRTPAFSA